MAAKTTDKTTDKKDNKKNLITDINALSPELLELITKQVSAQIISNLPKEEKKVENKGNRRKSLSMDFDLEELIPVKSIFHGTVECKTRAGKPKIWKECGTVQYMAIGDVINMNATDSIYLFTPRLIVEDNEVAEYLGTTEINQIAEKISDIDKFLKLDIEEINDILDRLPIGLKHSIYGELARRIENKEIDSLRIVRLVSKKVGIDYER
ncbi:MAG: hypothetical protein RSA91_01045 [Bacilli bacterium]